MQGPRDIEAGGSHRVFDLTLLDFSTGYHMRGFAGRPVGDVEVAGQMER